MRKGNPRSGFTLIELVVALAVGGVLFVTARALFEALASQEASLVREAANIDERADGERVLRELAARIDAGPTGAQFRGAPTATQFSTWCDTPSGWLERCTATLTITEVDSAPALLATIPTGKVILRRGFRDGSFRYLGSTEGAFQWFSHWGTGRTAPVALGVLLDRDTLLVRLGI